MSKLFLLCKPNDYETIKSKNATPIVMQYGVNELLRLFRSGPKKNYGGAFMGITDQYAKSDDRLKKNLENKNALQSLCKAIITEYYHGHFSGLFLDFSPGLFWDSLARLLVQQRPKNSPIFISSLSLEEKIGGTILVPCYGGELPLATSIEKEKQQSASFSMLLPLLGVSFPLPDIEGCHIFLSPSKAQALAKEKSCPIFYDALHCCHYFTFMENEKPHICLYDTKETFSSRLTFLQKQKAASIFCEYKDILALFGPDDSPFFSLFPAK